MLPRAPRKPAKSSPPRSSRIQELRKGEGDQHRSDTVDARLEALELALHDLQSPVAVLDVSMKLLATDLVDASPEILDTLLDARRATQRIRQYIDHLVVSERLRTGSMEPLRALVDLRSRLAELVEEFAAHARLVGAELAADLPSASSVGLSLRADETLLVRVFQNLLENALRHAGTGGRVLLSARRDSVIEVSVRNDGPSIPQDQREQIFRKFSASSRNAKPAGLGLYFCRLVIEAHRGTLVIEDDPVWPVCFVLRIPTTAL